MGQLLVAWGVVGGRRPTDSARIREYRNRQRAKLGKPPIRPGR